MTLLRLNFFFFLDQMMMNFFFGLVFIGLWIFPRSPLPYITRTTLLDDVLQTQEKDQSTSFVGINFLIVKLVTEFLKYEFRERNYRERESAFHFIKWVFCLPLGKNRRCIYRQNWFDMSRRCYQCYDDKCRCSCALDDICLLVPMLIYTRTCKPSLITWNILILNYLS